jgi:hypothetical protein
VKEAALAGIEGLLRSYDNYVTLPWENNLAGPQKVWFAIYNPPDERRLRTRIGEFEMATRRAGYDWRHCDLTPLFARWMAAHRYRDSYFARPESLTTMALSKFEAHIVETLRMALAADDVHERTVFAVSGVASLFGFTRISSVLDAISNSIRGRLLVFFPGERDGANYRLLDARDGWSYLAIPITAQES